MTLTTLNRLPVITPITLALCAWSSGVHAQSMPLPPNAGQVLRELQPSPALQTPQAPLLPQPDIQRPAPATSDEATVLVKSFVITGNQELSTAELQALVANLTSTEQSLTQLSAVAQRITAYYRARGFAAVRAYLPAQDITSGVVTIQIIEGKLASQRLNNQSRLSSERAQAYLDKIRPDDVIESSKIDRSVLLLQDTPGVGASRATLLPGASVGTSDLLIELDAAPAYGGTATLDNYGSRYTGVYRLGASFNLASPLRIGDQLSFMGLTSGQNLRFDRLAYQAPLGSNGLRVGAAYLQTNYQLGKEFSLLVANGSANSVSIFSAYPFLRSKFSNLSGTVSLEHKHTIDRIGSTLTLTDKNVAVTSLGLVGSRQDAWNDGGINAFELNLALGNLSINSPAALAIDALSSQSNGRYSRLTYSASRLQRLSDATALSVLLSGQLASKNLDSSEKFSLGGASGVRAYPQGEGIGDEGQRIAIELQQSLAVGLQGIVFYDVGRITINKSPFDPSTDNSRTLAGLGIGLNASFSKVQLRSSLGWRTHGGSPISVPSSDAKHPTLWVMASVAF